TAAPKKPAPQPDPAGVLTFACGHRLPVKSFEGLACPQCLAAGRKRRNQERARQRGSPQHRLPDRSAFLVEYDAAVEAWSGTFEVPGAGSFSGSCRAVFGLLQLLDDKYRASAAGRGEGD